MNITYEKIMYTSNFELDKINNKQNKSGTIYIYYTH